MSAPFSRFRCNECSTKFKLKRPLWYWLLPLALWATIFIGGLAIIYFMAGHCDYRDYVKPSVVMLTALSIFTYALIDRHIENGFSTVEL